MKKFGKKYNKVLELFEKNKKYSISEALELIKKTSITKFESTIEVAFKLNIDYKKPEHNIRGSVILPNGTGKNKKILVLTNEKIIEAKNSGADFFGGKELIEKIKQENWFEFDIIIATPDIMNELGKIGKILGPKGLMPNTKSETVTIDIKKSVEQFKNGKIEYRSDKGGNIHFIIGKTFFEIDFLKQNYEIIFDCVLKSKPHKFKNNIEFIKNITISTTMGPGIKLLF